jgi:hypothetical protein
VTLTQGCTPTSVRRNASSVCTVSATNNSFTDSDVDLTTTVNNRLRLIGASGATLANNRVRKTATLAGATLGVPSVDPGTIAGYIPLDLFGGTLVTPIGDETMTNFNVPAFSYNGEVANRVGVDSNGYLVVGGGTAEDNNCCNLPLGASPERPNNILAPFWTDLDGTGTGTGTTGVLVNVLTDGVNTWLVVEWRVNVFGTTDQRRFQTWIGVDGTQDIAFSYENAMADPAGQDYLVGAENAAGDGDVSRFLPTEDQRVTSTDPTPGATVTYTVTVRGRTVGAGNVHTDMTATGVKGVTTADTPVQVTR